MIQLNELFRLKDGYRPANFIVRKTVINPEHLVYVKDVTPHDLKYYSKILSEQKLSFPDGGPTQISRLRLMGTTEDIIVLSSVESVLSEIDIKKKRLLNG